MLIAHERFTSQNIGVAAIQLQNKGKARWVTDAWKRYDSILTAEQAHHAVP
jgi:hypothetical protein